MSGGREGTEGNRGRFPSEAAKPEPPGARRPPGPTPEEISAYWFDDVLYDPDTAQRRLDFWFRSTRETDEEIRRRFAPALKAAGEGLLAHWEAAPRSRLALVIVLDQFPRNIHRGTPAAFAHDARALAVARRGVDAGDTRALAVPEHAFLLMPFQHCEDLAVQRESVERFERFAAEAPAEWRGFAEGNLEYARLHLEIVERFGRFPHRNAILGRPSTAQEIEFLDSGAERFGQS